MMIVNPFPDLLFYSFYAPTILRLLLGVVFLDFGFSKLSKDKAVKAEFFEKIGFRPGTLYAKIFAGIEILAGTSLVLGLYTQIGAIIAGLILAGTVAIKHKHPDYLPGNARYYFALFIIAVSLLLTGAGAQAIDLPL